MKPSRLNFFLLFLIVVFLEISLTSYLITHRRMVAGHDGFEWFADQWFFINSRVSHHEIPLWTPYMDHGQVTSYIYNRLGMFMNVLMLFSGWIKHVNFFILFYAGLFFDRFVLLAGTWLLAKRYFKNPVTVFFVASTVVASTVSLTQITHTILLIYCLPLTLYLLHRFFDAWKWQWLFLAVFLISVVSVNVYYFIAPFSLAVFMYFAVTFTVAPVNFTDLKIKRSDLAWLIAIGAIVLLMLRVFCLEHDPLWCIHVPYREPNGHIPLDVFLQYGGGVYLFKWWELFLGTSLGRDNTLYMGILTLPLIFIGAASRNKNKYPFLIGAIFFLMFSLATPIAVLSYYGWPMMKFFRHIGLITPLIKFYLCFLAGFAFEEFFCFEGDQPSKKVFYKALFASILLFLNSLFLYKLAVDVPLGDFFISHLEQGINLPDNIRYSLLFSMACLSTGGALIFALRPLINRNKFLFTAVVILFQIMSLYGYAYHQIQLRTFRLTGQEYALMKFQKIPFVPRRLLYEDASPRSALIDRLGGVIYDETYNFTFNDVVKTRYRSDISLRPYDTLCNLFNHELSPAFLKLAGSSEDKIQFFYQAYPLKTLTSVFRNKVFSGDMLFYYPWDGKELTEGQLEGLDLSQNQRLNIPYRIVSFSPNQITIAIDHVPQQGVWMEYADTWHSRWKALLNANPQEIYIGNAAYKAIPLEKGNNVVCFHFGSAPLMTVYYYLMVGSLIWMVLLIWLLI